MPYKDLDKKKGAQRRYKESHKEELRQKQVEYYRANRDKRIASSKASRLRHPDHKIRNRQRLQRIRISKRKAVIEALGGKCTKCGYCADWRAFQIDHINGGGNKFRQGKTPKQQYEDIIEDIKNNSGKYQLLCANCNQIKRYDEKESSTSSFSQSIVI